MALSVTSICNMALARIGGNRINDIDTDTSVEAIQCRTHYEQTRDMLLRSHPWRFAVGRAVLSQDATDPSFDWDSQFVLPSDFLRMVYVWSDTGTSGTGTIESYALEGQRLLINDSECSIVYVKRITDPAQFDPAFVRVLVLALACELIMPLSQDKVAARDLQDQLDRSMSYIRTVDKQEQNTTGRAALGTWYDSLLAGSVDPAHM